MTNVISRYALLEYIDSDQVAFQFGDGLMTFTHTGDDFETEDLRSFVSASFEINEVLASEVITENNELGFNELAKWSQDSDMLILLDKTLLLCLPKKDYCRINLQIA